VVGPCLVGPGKAWPCVVTCGDVGHGYARYDAVGNGRAWLSDASPGIARRSIDCAIF
jgi:hypothetical protein